MNRRWVRAWVLWLLAAGLSFGAMEAWVLLDHNPATPPLTEVLVTYAPAEVALTVLLWALLHLGVRYYRRERDRE